MTYTTPATLDLVSLTAECKVTTQGFGTEEDRDWTINTLSLTLAENGFRFGCLWSKWARRAGGGMNLVLTDVDCKRHLRYFRRKPENEESLVLNVVIVRC